MGGSTIQNPAIFTVISSQAMLHCKQLARIEGIFVNVEAVREVIRMNAFCPAISKLLLQFSAGKVEPAFSEEGAEFVQAGHPDEHGRGVGDRAKTRITLTHLVLCYFAF